MKITFTSFSFLFLLTVVSLSAQAQKVIQGRVVDRETGKPIPFASIGIVGTSKGTSTNVDGQFSLVVDQSGPVKITCVGYESVQLTSLDFIEEIQLSPIAIQLKDVVVFGKELSPNKMVRKALMNIADNYPDQSFFQTFFYRHYCQDDGRYGRLIEAFVDVWKRNGYRELRSNAGQREDLRVSQLRRSLDRTAVAQSHEPIAVGGALLADIAAYQVPKESGPLDFYAGLSNLRSEVENYDFTFTGLTSHDGEEVYEVKYEYPGTRYQNPAGFPFPPKLSGTLFITTGNYAIVRAEELRHRRNDTIRTSVFYQKHNNRYVPYHITRDGGTYSAGKKIHWFHIELISVEISDDASKRFEGELPNKEQLLSIKYDPSYWAQHSVLTATPLEQQIIHDLGGGKSLEQQFDLYQQYQINTNDGGVNGAEKLQWLTHFLRDQNPVLVCYWDGNYNKNMAELEAFKQLNRKYRGQCTFVMVSTDDNQERWIETVKKNNLELDGLIQYRIGNTASITSGKPMYRISNGNGELQNLIVDTEHSLEASIPGPRKTN